MGQIVPERTNWKQFCEEPPLTGEEYSLWGRAAWEMSRNPRLFDFVYLETKAEWQAARSAESTVEDWSDMVTWLDTDRRLKRAEIKAWEQWKRQAG